jgi:hypothetical protein
MARKIHRKREENPLSDDNLLSKVKELKSRGNNWRQIKRELHIGSNRLTRLWKIMRSHETGTIEIPPPAESEILKRTMNKATGKISSTLSEMLYQDYIDAMDAGRALMELENRYKISVKEMGYEWDDFVRQSLEAGYTNLRDYKSIQSSLALITGKGENNNNISSELPKSQITTNERDKNSNDKFFEDLMKMELLLFLHKIVKEFSSGDGKGEYEAEVQQLRREIDDINSEMRFDEYTGKIVSALDRIRDAIDRNSETIHSLIKNINENSSSYNKNTRMMLQSISNKIDLLPEKFSSSNGGLTPDQVDLLKDQMEEIIGIMKKLTSNIEK